MTAKKRRPRGGGELDRFLRAVTKHRDAIAKRRDALRDLIADAEGIAECCDRAIDDLNCACQTLERIPMNAHKERPKA